MNDKMKRFLGRIILSILAAGVGWQLLRAARAVRSEYKFFSAPRSIPELPTDAAALGLRVVEFKSADGTRLKGWYVPSTTGAAVVAVGGSSATRDRMLPYARILVAGGTGVLLFDWPGCGESEGKIGLGPKERDAVRAATAYVAGQPDVEPGRLGLLGFSLGAHVALLAAADDSLVSALFVEGVFGSPWTQGLAEYAPSGVASQWGALLGDWLNGMERNTPDAAEAARRFAPRPMLIVAGTDDHTVPAFLSREVYDNAREPKTFWLIPGAEHGGYLRADPMYSARLREFIEHALARKPV